MAHTNKYMPKSYSGHSQTYKLNTVQACIEFLSKISCRYIRKHGAYISNQEEEAVVGYESSWAGISKNAKFR